MKYGIIELHDNYDFNAPNAHREVVMCRDCKYLCHYADGHIECRLLAELKPIPTTYCTMKPDDFCSYGEREGV